MRRVTVEGKSYDIPDGETYKVQAVVNCPGSTVMRQYFFYPNPAKNVRVEEICTPIGLYANNESVGEQVEIYEVPLSEFLLDNRVPEPGCRRSRFDELYAKSVLNSPREYATIDELGLGNPTIIPVEYSFTQSLLSEKPKSKEKSVNHQFFTGQRVFINNDKIGTVVGDANPIIAGASKEAKNKYRSDAVLVCMDEDDVTYTDGGTATAGYTGRYRSRIVLPEHLTPVAEQLEDSTYAFRDVPADVLVFARSSFHHQEGSFRIGDAGRLISRTNVYATVAWYKPYKFTWTHEGPQGNTPNVYTVPIHNLQWGLGRDGKILKKWPLSRADAQVNYKKGDLVLLHGGRNLTCYDIGGHERVLPEGMIAKVLAEPREDDRHGQTTVRIAGGPDPDFFDQEIVVRRDFIRAFERAQNFFARGSQVEIVAEIDFRNYNLKGKIAKVVLPTDAEGDVGLEFPEDIKAGSLDGVGKQGHCLYVQAGALKESE